MENLIEWLQKNWSASNNDEAIKVADTLVKADIKASPLVQTDGGSAVTAPNFIEK